VKLRRKLPDIERPYRSPVGEWGALVAGAIALVCLGAIFWNDDYRAGVYGVAVFYLVAVAYFAIAGRHRLVLSPEEEFALSHGASGSEAMATAEHLGGGLQAQMDEAPPPPPAGTESR
jgi:ethanolamine permease